MHKIYSIYSFFSKRYYTIWLVFLSFFITTTALPVIAQQKPFIPVNQQVNYNLTLLEQGINLFQASKFTEAIKIWQQALQEYQTKGDRSNQALTGNYLANAYQQLGQWELAEKAISESINLLNTQPNPYILAKVLNTRGSIQLAMGQSENALQSWEEAEKIYTNLQDETGKLGSKINQSQALQTLGLYRRSKHILEEVNQHLQNQPDTQLKVTGLRSLGIALQAVGDLKKSQNLLEQSLELAQRLNLPTDTSAALFALANNYRELKQFEPALELYQKSARITTTTTAKIDNLLNQTSLLLQIKKPQQALELLPTIYLQLEKLSPSRNTVYQRVNLAESLIKLKEGGHIKGNSIAELLAKAVQEARILKDSRAESEALGTLGKVYKKNQQWEEAEKLTKQALILAQGINSADIGARWQEQLGEILKQKGNIPEAIAAYKEAVNSLQSLRSDLVAINSELQFSFRQSVEPVYRELVSLLLQSNPSQENLKTARQVIEALQLAELDNFFREACLNVKPQQIDQLDAKAAVIYPIILSDRLEVIVSLPGKPLRHYSNNIPQKQVEKTLTDLLESLNPFFSNQQRLNLSQIVYNWLIKPIEEALQANNIKTLVFVLDGSLRNLPMAALHDGKQYLIEKYSIALTPGLQLLPARSLAQEQIKALTAGLTEARQGFSALPGVEKEIKQIATELSSKIFLDREFTEENLQKQLKSAAYPVIHLATHGQFSSNPEETFILTWDKKIKVKEFEDLLKSRNFSTTSSREARENNPIELLVLSACQTAAGDNRAALGLAGVAVRSGARSTLATLWSVKDKSTAMLMTEFYREFTQPGISKAEALRQAQLNLLQKSTFKHPFYWAPFILVGNWL